MSKIIKYLLIFIIGIIVGYFSIQNSNTIESTIPPKIEEIEQDSVKRDSIIKANDSIITKIIYIEKEYEKEVSNVMSNDDSTNMVLFSRYIEDYKRTITNN